MDIEWAIEKGNIFILQARPITTILNFNNTYND
jgi:phosphoenolpyruvate synthase/pyruvate phosphate dikinase